MTHVDKLVAYLRTHPGSTSWDITVAIGCVNVTGRVSDARAEGHVIDCRREGGRFRYYLLEKPEQRELGLSA